MVSMKDIAKKCGVSIATVSKALNGQKDIGEETRKRICAVAEEMGYMANSVARALKTNRSYNLGMLLVDERRSGLGHEYFSTIIEGFKAEAESHGYDITFINSHVGDQPTSYVKHCRYRGLDGVLVACVNFEDPRIQELAASNIPLVTIDYCFDSHTAVLSDNTSGVETLVRYAYNKGHAAIHLSGNLAVNLLALEDHLARGGRVDADDCTADGRLAGARLAHQTESLAFVDVEADVIDGLESVLALTEADVHILDRKEDFALISHSPSLLPSPAS